MGYLETQQASKDLMVSIHEFCTWIHDESLKKSPADCQSAEDHCRSFRSSHFCPFLVQKNSMVQESFNFDRPDFCLRIHLSIRAAPRLRSAGRHSPFASRFSPQLATGPAATTGRCLRLLLPWLPRALGTDREALGMRS